MVEYQLRGRATRNPAVLAAMLAVPRHRFVPNLPLDEAYADKALPAAEGQTISQPYMVALMTDLLHLTPGQRVLEIGTGTGYQTAILAYLQVQVVTIERSAVLAEMARAALTRLGYRVTEGDMNGDAASIPRGDKTSCVPVSLPGVMGPIKIVVGDGTLGWPEDTPYDRILVTAGAPRIPAAFRGQTKDSGRIVIPVGDREDQHLIVAECRGGTWSESRSVACRFVPLIGADGWAG
jgi:protein-L-isoaspartate(D-aspartate) O-methyltransferase